MADLGDIGIATGFARQISAAFADRAMAVVSGSGASAGAYVVVLLRGAVVAAAIANGAGAWTVSGLNSGTYWAVEVGTLRAWLVEVDGATVTVTLQTGGGGGSTVIAGHAWACIG